MDFTFGKKVPPAALAKVDGKARGIYEVSLAEKGGGGGGGSSRGRKKIFIMGGRSPLSGGGLKEKEICSGAKKGGLPSGTTNVPLKRRAASAIHRGPIFS